MQITLKICFIDTPSAGNFVFVLSLFFSPWLKTFWKRANLALFTKFSRYFWVWIRVCSTFIFQNIDRNFLCLCNTRFLLLIFIYFYVSLVGLLNIFPKRETLVLFIKYSNICSYVYIYCFKQEILTVQLFALK